MKILWCDDRHCQVWGEENEEFKPENSVLTVKAECNGLELFFIT